MSSQPDSAQAAIADALTKQFGLDASSEAMAAHERHLSSHGDRPLWDQALAALPRTDAGWSLRDGWLVAGAPVADAAGLADTLKSFLPWRKGPLVLGGVPIETEWRSDWKWDRIASYLDLTGARVLDVGAGNGYFGWRMLDHGAAFVLGCDPSQLFVMQHAVVRHFAGSAAHELLALRLEDLPPGFGQFDVVFSMGVLYHRREPADHLARLRERLRPGGSLVLETLILPDPGPAVLEGPKRYAGMRNVHALPSLVSLTGWLELAGYTATRCVDVNVTSREEQRSTPWMPFHSLAESLNEANPDLTCEGLPRPRRAMLIAQA